MTADQKLKLHHYLASAFTAGLVGPLSTALVLFGLIIAVGLVERVGPAETLMLALPS